MKKSILLLLFIFSVTAAPVFAECTLPGKITLSAKEDYAKYNQLVVDCVGWLESTSFKTDRKKRSEVQAFIVQWVTGSPDTHVQIDSFALNVWSADSEKLMVLFLGGWSRASILADNDIEDIDALAEAVRTVLRGFELDGAPKKSKEIKRLIKAEEKGTLIEYLEKKTK